MDLFILFDIIKTVNEVSTDKAYFFVSTPIVNWIIKGYFILDVVNSDVCNSMLII